MANRQIIRFLDNLSPSEFKIKDLPRKAQALCNYTFNEYGQLEKRNGYVTHNVTSLGTGHKITGLHMRYAQDTTTKELLAAWNTKIYKFSATTPFAGTALYSTGTTDRTFTADKDTYFEDFKNRTYIVNGADGLFKYGGSFVRTVGITAPGAPTFNANANGSLTAGNYYFKYTFVDEDGFESNGGTISAVMTAGANPNDGITINIAASADPKVNRRRIYRTTVGGTVFYYDGEVANNADLTYTSTISDALLMVKSKLATEHDAPVSTPHLITKRRSRIVLADAENTIPSVITDEYFPSALTFPSGNKQKVTGLKEQLTTLPVFTENSLERLTGFDEDNFEFKNAYSNEGCTAPRSLVNCKNLLVYLAFDGIYYFDGTVGKHLSKQLSEYVIDNLNFTYRSLSVGFFWKDRYYLSYPKGSSTVPNETVFFDFDNHTTGIDNYGFSCYAIADKGGDTPTLYAGSNTEGQVYKLFNGLSDNGSAITCYDDIDFLDLGMPDVYKKWYYVYIKVKSTTATTLTLYYTLDDGTETSVTRTIEANKTKWYLIGFGTSGLRGRALKPKFSFSDAYANTIMGYMFCYDISTEPPEWNK
jgi:hypothetical protein